MNFHLILLHILSLLWTSTSPKQTFLKSHLKHPVAAAVPLLEARPFTVVWNMPTARCEEEYGIHLNLEAFDIIENYHEKFMGQNMTIFYYNRLGLYPYISKEGKRVNGGVPQRGNLEVHLGKARAQIKNLLSPAFHGLAVIDWEKWRPLWVRNFGVLKKYRLMSEGLVKKEHPELSRREVLLRARKEFETGARNFMSQTLKLGADVRPAGLWGFYGLPGCFNYNKRQLSHNYTGHCHPKTSERNDRLDWLWRSSLTLFPSIYLPLPLAGLQNAALMVRYRVLEALRVASKYSSSSKVMPVLPYARVAFVHTLRFLTKTDLEHTLGEAAALGAAGVVLWGELRFAKSKHQCEMLRDYVAQILGIYVKSLKSRVQQCSVGLCGGNGRCARRDPHSGHYMHQSKSCLSSTSQWPLSCNSTYENSQLRSAFRCECYQGWTGEWCQERMPSETDQVFNEV
ncbi:hyaluronidase-3 [Scleropages formosus]|uniref:Hyaluronidase n=1 Tax=Scleropages formosus TaxID=113540 RepID=A0A8C9V7A3_SCLFO|nr:hyaluronidase-3-like [Scleropages formosus]XP_018593133.1 hyaluronidase-3-like [Scleropages formosus]XP_018593134.1 hyaluronidase-3-like [Scleropages formosus]XP_018593135.1 hyaluronidase-3-like [Scleropages formosus]